MGLKLFSFVLMLVALGAMTNGSPTCPIGMMDAAAFRSCDSLNPCDQGAMCWPRDSTNNGGVCCEPIADCQRFFPFVRTACHHVCTSHDECLDGEKCCQTGCGAQCVRV